MYAEVVVDRPIVRRERSWLSDGPEDPDIPYPEVALLASGEASEEENPLALTFHYAVPAALAGRLQPGHLVAVPFRTQQLPAVVLALSDSAPVEHTRPVSAILDPAPVLSPAQIGLATWLSREYLAPLATCVRHFLPPGSGQEPEMLIGAVPAGPTPPAGLNAREQALLAYLRQRGPVPLAGVEPALAESLASKGLVRQEAGLTRPRVGPKIDRAVELLIPPDQIEGVLTSLGHASRPADLLLHLAELDDPLPPLDETIAQVGCSREQVRSLAEQGWLEIIPRQTLLAIPPGRQAEVKTALAGANGGDSAALESLTKSQAGQAILRYLSQHDQPHPLDAVLAAAGAGRVSLTPLLKKGLVARLDEPDRLALTLAPEDLTRVVVQLRRAQKHAAVLNLLAAEEGPVWIGWVYAQTAANRQVLQELAEANLISLAESRRWRDPLAGKMFTLESPPVLTPEQEAVWEAIRQEWQPGEGRAVTPMLLHGVTGSGKTEIYLRAIAAAIEAGQGAIMLVPEITLATQTVERVSVRFPGKVAIWHSALSPGERYDTWERVRSGELPVVVGPRSALFAPVRRLGVIVVDEEHEPAYKQRERPPIFHARETALELGRLSQALVILGSATPDVVTYRKAERGEYRLLSLPYRILAHTSHLAVQQAMMKGRRMEDGGWKIGDQKREQPSNPPTLQPSPVALPLPQVEVVDLREELKAGNRTIFSRALQDAMHATLGRGEQVILFLNRRGTASFVICRDCGFVMRCPRCETTLTYHANGELMTCHYCGYRQRPAETCPQCGSVRIRYFGLGTERVEAAVKTMFPKAQVIRWDLDTTRQKGSHELFLQHFVAGRANVMVGTQMVAKGLDLPLVTLVGVISADTALYLPDFRAAERTFQLLMQVAGRAGRSPLGGRVIIQTYNPDQVSIEAAANHDYIGFYQTELAFRQEQGYPPFKRLAMLLYTGHGPDRSSAEAEKMAERLRFHVARWGLPAVEVIGPTPSYIRRVRSQYRWHILLRAQDPAAVLRPLLPLPAGWRVDIDPVSLL